MHETFIKQRCCIFCSQVDAETDVINESWDLEGNSKNLADSVGLMVYEGSQALQYVKNFVNGADQWGGNGKALTTF